MNNNSKNECTTGYDGVNISFTHQFKKGEGKKPCIQSYAKLGGVSNGFYIKIYEVNWGYK